MCDCLGKAIMRHIEYSEGELWFLDQKKELKKQQRRLDQDPNADIVVNFNNVDLTESGISDQTAFTYNFKDDLKINLPQKQEEEDFERSIGELEIDKIDAFKTEARPQEMSMTKNSAATEMLEEAKNEAMEQRKVEMMRKEQLMSSQKDTNASYIQLKLIEKDKKIKKLTELVQAYEKG